MMSARLLGMAPVPGHEIGTRGPRVRTIRAQADARMAALGVAGLGIAVHIAALAGGSNTVVAWLGWSAFHGAIAAVLAMVGIVRVGRLDRPAAAVFALGCALAAVAFLQALPVAVPVLRGFAGGWPAIAPGSALVAGLRIGGVLALFLSAFCLIRSGASATTLLRIIAFGVAGHAVWALHMLTLGAGPGAEAYAGAATGGFVSKNAFATYLGMGFVTAIALVTRRPARVRDLRWFAEAFALWVALAAIIAALAATNSRLGITATALAAPLALPAARRRPAAFLVSGALALLLASPSSDLSRLGIDLRTRLDLYAQVIGMIATRPLGGFGLDSFALAFERFHQAPVTAAFVWDHAHSTYLTLWVEAGVIAGSLPLVAGWIAARRLHLAARSRAPAAPPFRAALAALVLVAIHATADFTIEMLANLQLLVFLVAGAMACATLADERRRRN